MSELQNHGINPQTIIKMAQCITQIGKDWDILGGAKGGKTHYLSVLVSLLRY